MSIKTRTKITDTFPSVRVRWEDTRGHDGWSDKGSYDTIMVDTHGYLIEHTPTKAVIAASMTDHGLFNDVSAIPVGCIKEIVRTEDGKRIKKRKG